MSFGIVATVGAGIAGAAISSNGAKKAAGQQAAATDRANAVSQGQFDKLREDQSGYRQQGQKSTNMLSAMLGLSGQFDGMSREEIRERMAHQFRVNDPNNPNGIDDIGLNAAVDAEMGARSMAESLGGVGQGYLLKNFTGDDLENDPGYQFGRDQGQRALDNRLASAGSYFSGAALKGAAKFNNDYASTKFGDAFNRDAANKTRVYNFLTGQQTLGQNAAAQTGNAGMAMAGQVGANTTAMGNAAGAASIAQGNAWGGALTGAAGAYNQNEMMNKITGGNAGWGSQGGWQGGGRVVPTYPGAEY